jgi:hypothetical protein
MYNTTFFQMLLGNPPSFIYAEHIFSYVAGQPTMMPSMQNTTFSICCWATHHDAIYAEHHFFHMLLGNPP